MRATINGSLWNNRTQDVQAHSLQLTTDSKGGVHLTAGHENNAPSGSGCILYARSAKLEHHARHLTSATAGSCSTPSPATMAGFTLTIKGDVLYPNPSMTSSCICRLVLYMLLVSLQQTNEICSPKEHALLAGNGLAQQLLFDNHKTLPGHDSLWMAMTQQLTPEMQP